MQERLRHVDSTAQQARRLHAALNEAALLLKNPDSGAAPLVAPLIFTCILGVSPLRRWRILCTKPALKTRTTDVGAQTHYEVARIEIV